MYQMNEEAGHHGNDNRTQPFAKNMTYEVEDHVMMLCLWFLFVCAGIGHVVFFGENHPATLGTSERKGRGRRHCAQGQEGGGGTPSTQKTGNSERK